MLTRPQPLPIPVRSQPVKEPSVLDPLAPQRHTMLREIRDCVAALPFSDYLIDLLHSPRLHRLIRTGYIEGMVRQNRTRQELFKYIDLRPRADFPLPVCTAVIRHTLPDYYGRGRRNGVSKSGRQRGSFISDCALPQLSKHMRQNADVGYVACAHAIIISFS